jgi:hypothetical protein
MHRQHALRIRNADARQLAGESFVLRNRRSRLISSTSATQLWWRSNLS